MSRTLLLVLAMSAASPAAAEPLSAEQALDTYKALTATSRPCRPAANQDEIVVCARDDDRYRLPLPDERGPRDTARAESGVIPSGSADPAKSGNCGIVQGGRVCNQGLTIIKSRF